MKGFRFNLRELAGSLGDFGTLLPLAIGYITVCKLNPAGLLVMMGLVNTRSPAGRSRASANSWGND